jgi:hypothetical protein
MMGTTPDLSPPLRSGRGLLWLGLFCVVLGRLLYLAQAWSGSLTTPWYIPALMTLAVVLLALAVWRRRSVWRILALAVVLVLTGAQWWFFVRYVRLPAYEGPVTAGEPFPAFRAARADGTAFSGADLKGDRDTVLVFFRGHW